MPAKATAEDANIIMQLYDLRRESEMRKARHWFAGFWPRSADDVVQLINARGTQENAWFRQASTYWEMAASFVLRGAVNEELFFDNSNELWFYFSRVHPFLTEAREKAVSPYLFHRCEKVASRTKEGRQRLQFFLKRAEAMRASWAKAS